MTASSMVQRRLCDRISINEIKYLNLIVFDRLGDHSPTNDNHVIRKQAGRVERIGFSVKVVVVDFGEGIIFVDCLVGQDG